MLSFKVFNLLGGASRRKKTLTSAPEDGWDCPTTPYSTSALRVFVCAKWGLRNGIAFTASSNGGECKEWGPNKLSSRHYQHSSTVNSQFIFYNACYYTRGLPEVLHCSYSFHSVSEICRARLNNKNDTGPWVSSVQNVIWNLAQNWTESVFKAYFPVIW